MNVELRSGMRDGIKTCCRSGRENKNTTSSDVPECCCWVSSDGGSAYYSGGRWEEEEDECSRYEGAGAGIGMLHAQRSGGSMEPLTRNAGSMHLLTVAVAPKNEGSPLATLLRQANCGLNICPSAARGTAL